MAEVDYIASDFETGANEEQMRYHSSYESSPSLDEVMARDRLSYYANSSMDGRLAMMAIRRDLRKLGIR